MRRTKHSDDSRLFYDWLEIAARDLLAARVLIGEEVCLEIAGFHCQQCMEKVFKAYLIHAAGVLVDGHNLTWLCRQAIRRDESFQRFLEATAGLNRLYIEARYPSDEELTLPADEAQKVYDIAKELYDMVCDQIYGPGDTDDDD